MEKNTQLNSYISPQINWALIYLTKSKEITENKGQHFYSSTNTNYKFVMIMN